MTRNPDQEFKIRKCAASVEKETASPKSPWRSTRPCGKKAERAVEIASSRPGGSGVYCLCSEHGPNDLYWVKVAHFVYVRDVPLSSLVNTPRQKAKAEFQNKLLVLMRLKASDPLSDEDMAECFKNALDIYSVTKVQNS